LFRSEYEARNEDELAVLFRYFPRTKVELKPAKFLDIILYSKEQLNLENVAMGKPVKDLDYEYGIISVKPQDIDYEIPMMPITMMRNALGKEHGGSGVPLEKSKYMESVNFWKNHAAVK